MTEEEQLKVAEVLASLKPDVNFNVPKHPFHRYMYGDVEFWSPLRAVPGAEASTWVQHCKEWYFRDDDLEEGTAPTLEGAIYQYLKQTNQL